jgi:hypothetical protein
LEGSCSLRDLAGVEIRIKHENSDPMHLKSYQIDGRFLRTGAANFSALRPFAAFALLKTICHDPHQSGSHWMALSLVAFLRADSNSCAVLAAATIEFIGEFNV